MDRKALLAAAVVIVAIIAAAVWYITSDNGNDSPEEGENITVVDSAQREITVSLPVTNVAICDPTLIEIFAMSVGEGWEEYVCLLPDDITTREPAKWQALLDQYPSLADVDRCPDLYATGTIPSEDIINSGADLVLLPGATVNYMEGMGQQVDTLQSQGIACVYLEFYDKSFTDGIAESNYGILGDIMGTSETADRVVEYYDRMVVEAKERIATAEKEFTYYVEIPLADSSVYGQVVAMGCPEFDVIGGTNICDNPAGVDTAWNLEKMQKPDGDGPDYIMIVSSPYFGSTALLGYGSDPTQAEMDAEVQKYLDRTGWENLGAVKDGNVMVYYGELRNSALGLVDLYQVAMMVYPDLFTQEDLDGVIAELDSLSPFGFEGTWMCTMGA